MHGVDVVVIVVVAAAATDAVDVIVTIAVLIDDRCGLIQPFQLN